MKRNRIFYLLYITICLMTFPYLGLSINDRKEEVLTGCCDAQSIAISNTGMNSLSKSYVGSEWIFSGSVCTSKPFTLTVSGCNNATSYSWNMADGTTYTGSSISHTYTATTVFLAELTIITPSCTTVVDLNIETQNCCCSNQIIKTSRLFLPEQNLPDITNTAFCKESTVYFYKSCLSPDATYSWNFGDNSALSSGSTAYHVYAAPGTYNVSLTQTLPSYCGSTVSTFTVNVRIIDCIPCTSCIGSFAPDPGEYIASVWVRETAPSNPYLFADAELKISFPGFTSVASFTATTNTKIIDGWQRLEGSFTVPPGAAQMMIELKNNSSGSNEVFFDDIRIHPFNSSQKTYVYDPITLRLVAELDERNYATFYEYDEEGNLIRVKKETEKGIMTIKETRQNNSK